jgi:hypothetical protein
MKVHASRRDHLIWCRQQAMESLETDDLVKVFEIMLFNINNNPDTENHSFIRIGILLKAEGYLQTKEDFVKWINHFI